MPRATRTNATRFTLAAAAFAALAVCPTPAPAQTTWNGNGLNDNWGNGANWVGGNPPANNGTAVVNFTGNNRRTPDLDADWNINRLTFGSSSGYTLGSSANHVLTLSGTNGITGGGLTSFVTITHGLTLAANQTWDPATPVRIDGDIGQTGGARSVSFSPTSNNTLTLGGNNTFSGGLTTTTGNARLWLRSATGFGAGNVVLTSATNTNFGDPGLGWQFASNTTQVIANNIQFGSGSFTTSFMNSGLNDVVGVTVRFNGVLSGGSATPPTITLDSSSTDVGNTLLFANAANTFRATLHLERGTIAFTSDGALGNADNDIEHNGRFNLGLLRFDGNVTLNPNRTITLAPGALGNPPSMRISSNGFNGTIQGLVQGPGLLLKEGLGTLTLTGNNTYAGGTTVSAGRLLVTNTTGSATGSGPVTVQNGAELGGTGFIGGPVGVDNGGTLSPGTSPGTLTINNNLTLNPTSQLNFELGTSSDLVVVNGNLTLDGVLNVTQLAGFGPGTYTLFDYSGTLTNNGVEFGTPPPAGLGYQIVIDQANTLVLLAVVPEPTTWALLGTAAVGVWTWRRRAKRQAELAAAAQAEAELVDVA